MAYGRMNCAIGIQKNDLVTSVQIRYRAGALAGLPYARGAYINNLAERMLGIHAAGALLYEPSRRSTEFVSKEPSLAF
jgi:hypothetical protein